MSGAHSPGSPFHALARAAGLDISYTDWRGKTAAASDESVLATLRAVGVDLRTPDEAASTLAMIERERWRELVPPVVIGWDGALVVPFAVPADVDGEWEIEVTTETGRTVRMHGRLFTLPADSHAWPGGAVHCIRRATIWLDGENGYHKVAWGVSGAYGEALGIAAPRRAWGGPGDGPRRWGVFAPVYGLAAPETGQAGDLLTLRRLFREVERRGGRYVAVLPILAQFLDEPCAFSPYSPASRLFWNELYLDLHRLAAEVGAAEPVAPPIVPNTPIDFREQYHWRRHVLDPMASAVLADPARSAEIDAWASETGAYDYAAFRALGESTRQPWRDWPVAWRDRVPLVTTRADAIALGAAGAHVNTHLVAQWAMSRQLASLGRGPVSLYLDLPVGVSSDAYEVWRYRHLFLTELSAGAPPDPLFLGGQSWGLPPLWPTALRRDQYRYFRRCVRHHMSVAGMLRIDHVMGLFRLYCVPQGRPATDGVYVRYPADELLAILTLESHRATCAIAGEDLGTVPPEVRPAMASHGLFRLHVGQWFFPSQIGDAPEASPREAIASLNTHDTATFAGWWRGADTDDRRDLGLITPAQEDEERELRDRQRAALLAYAGARLVDDTLTDVERAMVAATTDLAVGPAEVVLVALDDLALDPVPHNVPGTVHERPNWQRRIERWADALDERRAPPAAAAAVTAVIAARGGVGSSSGGSGSSGGSNGSSSGSSNGSSSGGGSNGSSGS
ncbi:MAG TPA: 4-alpha-glucanotransferase [Kofleriaceae bacterium]|nr:4-alpha-glucanotransferase [Kofleriaceae bacterium]